MQKRPAGSSTMNTLGVTPVRVAKPIDDFWEIIDDALEENARFVASAPWPPPPAMDPFNFTGCPRPPPFNFQSSEGQWEMLKELSRRQEAQDSAQRLVNISPVASPSAPMFGCTSISVEPNTSARPASMGSPPLRHDIDYPPKLLQSPLEEVSRKVMIMENDAPDELLNVQEWTDLDIDGPRQRVLRPHP